MESVLRTCFVGFWDIGIWGFDAFLYVWTHWPFVIYIAGIFLSLPFLSFLPFNVTLIYINLYHHWYGLKDCENEDSWNNVYESVTKGWLLFGKCFHGIEFTGLENIPRGKNDGALLVLYHGAFPIDFPYLMSKVFRHTGRKPFILGHRFNDQFPGTNITSKVLGVFTGPYQRFVEILKQGKLLMVAPGGTFEQSLSDQNYQIMWKNRIGFARGAIEAKVPVIPVFTENCNDAYRYSILPAGVNRLFYDLTGLFFTFPFGGWPVKMRIHLGEAIPYDPNITPEELAKKVAGKVQDLITKHQRIPGSMVQSLLDRFRTHKNKCD